MYAHRSQRPLHYTDLLRLLPWIPAGPVCDLGCGEGHLAAAIGSYGLPTVGVEVNREVLQKAQQRYGDRVAWEHNDLRNYRLQRESYACVICQDVLPFIPNGERARLIGRFKAALKPGGLLILTGLLENDVWAQQKHARTSNQISLKPTGVMRPGELSERLKDWEILYSFEGAARIPAFSPQLHQTTQIVARKPQPSAPAFQAARLPQLKLGCSWQPQLAKSGIFQQVGFVEFPADIYLEPEQDIYLNRVAQQHTIVLNCTGLSLGSPHLRQDGYLEALQRILQRCESPWWSTPLGYTRSENRESYQVHALPPTEEALETVKGNIRQLRQQISTPLLLSNPFYPPAELPGEMDQASFLRHVAQEADCGIVVDLLSLCLASYHSSQDPFAFVERLPAERIVHIRFSLHSPLPQMDLTAEIQEQQWQVARHLLQYSKPKALSLQLHRQSTAPEVSELLRRLQALWSQT